MNNNKKHNIRHDIYTIMQNRKLDRKNFIIRLFFSIIFTAVSLYQPKILATIYQQIEAKDINWLYIRTSISALFLVLNSLVWSIRKRYWEWMQYIINTTKYTKYRDIITNKDISLINDIGSGKIISKFNQWVDAESGIFDRIFYSVILITIRWGVSIYILASYNYKILFVIIPWFAFLYFTLKYFNKIYDPANEEINKIYAEWSRLNIRLISELLLIKINNKINHENQIFKNIYDPIIKLKQKVKLYWDLFYETNYIFMEWVVLLIISYIWIHIIWWIDNISTIILLTGYIYMMRRPMEYILISIPELSTQLTKYQDLQDFLNTPNKIINGKNKYIYKSWDIKLQNITFWYSEDRKIFDNLDISFPSGKTTALVGHSWSGKSTIIKLLLRLHDIDDGNIYIDNQNIHDIDISTLYDHIWYLTQEPAIFDWTIRENLMYGLADTFDIKSSENSELPDISKNSNIHKDSKSDHASNIYINQKDNLTLQDSVSSLDIFDSSVNINQVIKLSRCEWIYDLPNWLDTEIWEKGIRLSWWQRQRLAIAKIMIKNPDIILLDEPTSALDSENKELVTQALNNLFVGKTVIIIAHRLQTVKHSDQIIYINDWQVIESWTHDELLVLWWEYAKMVELQSWF